MRLAAMRGRLLAATAATAALCGWVAAGPVRAGPALLFDAGTGQVLYAEEPDRPWHPASLTKLMTAYLTFEAVTRGDIQLASEVELSPKARAQPATRVGLKRGIKLTVDQAVRALVMRSANDFAMALAETVSGSEDAFVVRMNTTARRLGMSRTQFRNPHGLPDAEQVTTARDMGLLARALLRDYPDYADVFSAMSVRIHKGTFHTANDLLRSLPGGDGMKTGFTCDGGYNVVASASRDSRRLIAVVLGEQNRMKRSQRAVALIEHGFATLDWKTLLAPPADLVTLSLDPATVDAPIYTAGTMRIRRCAMKRPIVEPDPEPDDATVASSPAAPGSEMKAAPGGRMAGAVVAVPPGTAPQPRRGRDAPDE